MKVRTDTESRGLPGVQRAYLYLVALVAIHMVVLGLANVIRIATEMVLNAPSGGFAGLPVVFVDYNAPTQEYRSQMSLAVSLVLVGGLAWAVHWGYAQRVAVRAAVERTSPMRGFYLNVVILVTSLLVYGYGMAALYNQYSEHPSAPAAGGFLGMVAAAGVALAYHWLVLRGDRRGHGVTGRAASWRRLRVYLLMVIGVWVSLFQAATLLNLLWGIAAAYLHLPGDGPWEAGLGLRHALANQLPFLVPSAALWALAWWPAQRLVARNDVEGAAERASTGRKLVLYAIILATAITALTGLGVILYLFVLILLGAPSATADPGTLINRVGSVVAVAGAPALTWVLGWRAISRDAGLEPDRERGAGIRRIYTYMVCAVTMAMIAVASAGLVGIAGAGVLLEHRHPVEETALYLTVMGLAVPVWALHWRSSRRAPDTAAERASRTRGLYLWAAVLGGMATVLVAGSAVLFQLINSSLAGTLNQEVLHTVWHWSVDTAVGITVMSVHWRVLRQDRRLRPAPAAAVVTGTHHFTVGVPGADREAALATLREALRRIPGADIGPEFEEVQKSAAGPVVATPFGQGQLVR